MKEPELTPAQIKWLRAKIDLAEKSGFSTKTEEEFLSEFKAKYFKENK
jgi:hypothetical protein